MWSSLWRVQRRVCGCSLAPRAWRSFSTSGVTMDKLAAQLETNPYYEKYAARIAELQRAAPDEFERRAQALVPPKRPATAPTKAKATDASSDGADLGRYGALLQPKEPRAAPQAVRERRLDEIFKTELVTDKTAEEIAAIWEQYHLQQPVVAAVLPVEAHERAMARAAQHPAFVVPLPRDQGYEFFLLQTAANTIHFTPLLAYQVHAENAPECLTVTHYTELSDKGIVLMRGEYDKSVISAVEARCLANQFQLYYAGCDEARLRLLETFTHRTDSFQHMELVKHLETISLDPPTGPSQAKPTSEGNPTL